jgi:hypothetical protein
MNPEFVKVRGFVYPKGEYFAFWVRLEFHDGQIVNYKEITGYLTKEAAVRDCNRAIEIKKGEIEVILIKNNQTAGITTAQIH